MVRPARIPPDGYREKFKGFLDLCRDSKKQGIKTVLIAEPMALGDNYEKLIESLRQLADHELSLTIVPQ